MEALTVMRIYERIQAGGYWTADSAMVGILRQKWIFCKSWAEYETVFIEGIKAGRIWEVTEMKTVEQKPSIGRIVIYNHPGSADGKYPPQQSPAIIQNVAEDGTCRLFVFGPKGQHMDEGLKQGDGPCQWNWPPRV